MSEVHDEIEFEEPSYSECDCCGALTTHLTRFVYRDDAAFAVYKAAFSDTPAHDWVNLLFSFGEWGEEASPSDRLAIACVMWVSEDGANNVRLVDPEESFGITGFFGRVLSREEALAHELTQKVFDLTDHIVLCDKPIVDFLEKFRGSS